MLRNSLTWLLLAVFSTALAACCGSVACNCPNDKNDDALSFRFNLDTLTTQGVRRGFFTDEIDSVYIRRVPIDTAQRPRADTVLLTGRPGYVATFVINNAQPFAQSSSRKLDRYDYTIYLGRRRQPTQQFVIDTVRVKDQFVGNGCCTCNQNVEKFVRLDGQPLNVTDPNGGDAAVEIQLNRKP